VPERYRAPAACPSFFLCDAPLESRAGAEAMGHDPEEARRMLAATSYRGQKLAFLTTTGGISQLAAQVMVQAMQRAGFDVEEQVMDWGTLLARRARREGWHLFSVYANGTDMFSPLTHFYVSNTCAEYPGWDCDREIERMLGAFADSADPAERRRLAEDIQAAAVRHVPSVMWGQFTNVLGGAGLKPPAAAPQRAAEAPKLSSARSMSAVVISHSLSKLATISRMNRPRSEAAFAGSPRWSTRRAKASCSGSGPS
jgi:peptide/nickel transport system substrate-binding protein